MLLIVALNPGLVKPRTIKLKIAAYQLSMQLYVARAKTDFRRNLIMCPQVEPLSSTIFTRRNILFNKVCQ
jgi:hypothetical protein